MDGIKEDIEDTEQSEIITYVTQNVDYTQLGQDKKIATDMIINGIKSACNGKVNAFIHEYHSKPFSMFDMIKKKMQNTFSSKFNQHTINTIINETFNLLIQKNKV